jgi:quercetin dioxygenase-like cupin family protein
MHTVKTLAAAALLAAGTLSMNLALAQQDGIGRTELQRHDLSAKGREVIQVRVDFAEGSSFPMHTHPGEEIAYVLEGSLEYSFQDKPAVTLKKGDTLFIPAGQPHAARHVGTGKASELATYVVEKGKPLVVKTK